MLLDVGFGVVLDGNLNNGVVYLLLKISRLMIVSFDVIIGLFFGISLFELGI